MSHDSSTLTDPDGSTPARRLAPSPTDRIAGDWTHARPTTSQRTGSARLLVCNWRDIEHPEAGGAEVFTHEVLTRLAERGHQPTMFAPAFDGCEPETEIDGVRVVRSGGKLSVYGRAVGHYRDADGAYDVVVEEVNGPPWLTPAYVDEPVMALVHHVVREEWVYEMPFPIGRLGYHLQDWWLKPYRSVPTVTVSMSSKRELEELGFSDVRIVPEGTDIEPLEAVPDKPDRPTFVYVGRMARAKRPDHALRAFEHLRERYPAARLHMVGDGYLLDRLRDEAGEGVVFHGYVPEQRKRELLRSSHVLLVPSVREGWGLVVTEANAMGTPAVGYNVKGLRDSIRTGENGLLAAQDPFRLAQRALTVLETDYESYTTAALEIARGHDWEATTDAFERELLEVIQ